MFLARVAANRGYAWWRRLANAVVGVIKDQTDRGLDVDGNQFKQYSEAYAKRKGEGKAGKLTKKGRGTRQASKRTQPPDLRLTGDMMRDLQVLDASSNGALIGWPTFGERVWFNAEQGRAIVRDSDDALPARANAIIRQAMDDDIDRTIAAFVKERTEFRISRKKSKV